MIYIYSSDLCPKCEKAKNDYETRNIPYTERSADRIKAPEDEIDRDALIQASLQNMELPVIVEVN